MNLFFDQTSDWINGNTQQWYATQPEGFFAEIWLWIIDPSLPDGWEYTVWILEWLRLTLSKSKESD